MGKSDQRSEFVNEAYAANDTSDLLDFYEKWAEEYDRKMLDELGYCSHATIACMLSEQLGNRDAAVLDIGCGTGLTCKLLADQGYRNLDGVDLSPDMVRVAGQRGIYRRLYVADVTEPMTFEDASYDAVISSGTFTHGHVGPEPIKEIMRILKPGGLLACTVHQDLWEAMGFKRMLEQLVETGIAECIELVHDKYYDKGEPEGWFCLHRRC